MSHFNKLPGFIRTPSGFEWILLKKLPLAFAIGTAIPASVIAFIYFNSPTLNPQQLKTIFQCLGVIFSVWFFVGATAIGCVVVWIMKGPAYVADPYDLPKENKSLEKHPHL